MIMPVLLRKELPVGMMGMLVLLMVMLMISTDDSRIFNSSATLVQDVIMPFRRKPFEKNEHLWWLRGMSLAVCAFFFLIPLFFARMDDIRMFFSIMCSLWLEAAGPIMRGGLYTRWGTTTGALFDGTEFHPELKPHAQKGSYFMNRGNGTKRPLSSSYRGISGRHSRRFNAAFPDGSASSNASDWSVQSGQYYYVNI